MRFWSAIGQHTNIPTFPQTNNALNHPTANTHTQATRSSTSSSAAAAAAVALRRVAACRNTNNQHEWIYERGARVRSASAATSALVAAARRVLDERAMRVRTQIARQIVYSRVSREMRVCVCVCAICAHLRACMQLSGGCALCASARAYTHT